MHLICMNCIDSRYLWPIRINQSRFWIFCCGIRRNWLNFWHDFIPTDRKTNNLTTKKPIWSSKSKNWNRSQAVVRVVVAAAHPHRMRVRLAAVRRQIQIQQHQQHRAPEVIRRKVTQVSNKKKENKSPKIHTQIHTSCGYFDFVYVLLLSFFRFVCYFPLILCLFHLVVRFALRHKRSYAENNKFTFIFINKTAQNKNILEQWT